ncbi:MAG: hypothetical protein WAO98_01545 [Alphaproteobacteria bacterium]
MSEGQKYYVFTNKANAAPGIRQQLTDAGFEVANFYQDSRNPECFTVTASVLKTDELRAILNVAKAACVLRYFGDVHTFSTESSAARVEKPARRPLFAPEVG